MTIINNTDELLSHGNRKGRQIALDIIEHTLRSIDTYDLVRKAVSFDEKELIVGDLKYDLTKIKNIYVVGAGKGTIRMAEALNDILGKRIEQGIIIEKRGQNKDMQSIGRIKILEGAHPIPDEIGMQGTKQIVELAKRAQEQDLVFVCVMGGCSALMTKPAKGITLKDIQKTNDLLLKCGATINEINTVRKHISAVKGGRLAEYIYPAKIITLIVIDEVAGLPWGPTIPDTTTFENSIHILKKHDLWKKVPNIIRTYLKRGAIDQSLETPKAKDLESFKIQNLILANNNTACQAAKQRAQELKINASILTTVLEGESREVGIVLASIAKEIETRKRPLKPPCVLILGGETTVTITKEPGEGGRNQELVLASSLKISRSEKIVIASIGTDGTDGPTNIAGAIVDGFTIKRGTIKDLDLFENLRKHNSSFVFKKLTDAIITKPTGTNVMDLILVVVI